MAIEEEETRCDLRPDNFEYDGGYCVYRNCPVCGFLEYEEYNASEEEEDENRLPPDPFTEYDPDEIEAKKAGQIVNFIERIESEDDIYDFTIEYIWDRHSPGDDIVKLKYGLIPFVFQQRG